jgi:DNA-binding transcriptional regulator YdaS (Cro superfamily)
MKLKQYIQAKRGRLSELSEAIGAHSPDISRWADGSRPVPFPYGPKIEAATGGVVTRKDLFPNNWQELWPELAKQEAA